MPRLTLDSIRVKWQFGRFSFNRLYRFASGFSAMVVVLVGFFFDLLGGDVNHRPGIATIQAFDFFELAHDFFFAHAVDRAMSDFLAVDVNRAQGLAASVFGLDGRTIGARLQGLVADDLEVPHVPLERGAVLFAQLAPSLLDRGHDVRVGLGVGQLARPVLCPGFAVPGAQGGLFQGNVPIASTKLFDKLPFLGCQHPGLVGLDRGGDPGLDNRRAAAQFLAGQELLVLVAHQDTRQSRQPSPWRLQVNRVPGWRLEYM